MNQWNKVTQQLISSFLFAVPELKEPRQAEQLSIQQNKNFQRNDLQVSLTTEITLL